MRTKLVWGGIGLLLLILLGSGVYWFFQNHEQRTREISVDVSPFAKRNQLLAAERFLDRLGIVTESVSGRDHLLNPPQQSGLLLVSNLGSSLPADREEALLDWVKRGGHLVITPVNEWDDDEASGGNNLLDSLGVQLIIRESESDPEDESAEDESDQKLLPVVFEMPGFTGEVAVAFSDQRVLFDSEEQADWWIETDEGAHLLQFNLGRGKITVLSDHDFFSNKSIGEEDHALFLALLARDQKRAWLLYSSDMPSLFLLLWRHATSLVVSLLCLILLLVWFLTQRSGPIKSTDLIIRRNLMEHLSAVGHYIWRTDHAAQTFKQSQAALEQAWHRRHPILGTMERGARCEWIAEHVGLTPQSVEHALYGDYKGEQAFIQVTVAQQKLAAQLRNQQGLGSKGEN